MVTVIIIAFICVWLVLYASAVMYNADEVLFVVPVIFIILPAGIGLFLFLIEKYAPWFLS